MKPLFSLVFLTFLPFAAQAEGPLAPQPATSVQWEALIYHQRPVVVFADSPEDPAFLRQMALLARDTGELAERDVVLITDTDPAANSVWRQKLHPRGFSLVIIDKDGQVKQRKPQPWSVREIVSAIDKFPLRREEIGRARLMP